MREFVEFPKIARLSRECVITEKIDGTNAQIEIGSVDDLPADKVIAQIGNAVMCAGSRNRYITPTDDNFGFAAWVARHADALWALGVGRHFGEWWGSGIQRGYGLPKGEKRFSLFNVARWHSSDQLPFISQPADPRLPTKVSTMSPACCEVVPILYRGQFFTDAVDVALDRLSRNGSAASPGFAKPEGVVIFHTAANLYFKKTLEKDEEPKSFQRSGLRQAAPAVVASGELVELELTTREKV